MGLLKAVAPYSVLLFVAGLMLGIARGLWLFGGTANLLQVPILVAVALGVAPLIKQRIESRAQDVAFFSVGLLSMVCVVSGEFAGLLWFRGLTLRQYLQGYEGVSESVYTLLVGLLALAPLRARGLRRGGDGGSSAIANGGRVLGSLAGGLILSVLYHMAVLALLWNFKLPDSSLWVKVSLAAGIALAGPGFEAQAAVLPLNGVAMFAVFAYALWICLTHNSRGMK